VVDGMLGIIRVLTTGNQEVLQEHGRIMKEGFQVESVTRCIEGQENGIHNDLTEAIAIPKIIALAKKMSEEHDIDAITISCAADPALDEVRLVASLPILGAGVCGAYAASKVGQRVAIVGITATPPERMVKELGDRFHSFFIPLSTTFKVLHRCSLSLRSMILLERMYRKSYLKTVYVYQVIRR